MNNEKAFVVLRDSDTRRLGEKVEERLTAGYKVCNSGVLLHYDKRVEHWVHLVKEVRS